MSSRTGSYSHFYIRVFSLAFIFCVPLLAHFAAASEWPYPAWQTATPASQSMDVTELAKARDYALQGGGSGMITRNGYLVYSWGSLTRLYEMRSTTKSFGATMLGLAIGDGRVSLSARAQSYDTDVGIPPETNVATGWLGDITILNLATHTAGFPKTAAEAALIYKPGTKWGYSDGGADWLADVLTTRYDKDLYTVMNARVFTPLGIKSTDLTWRDNAWRSDTLDGIKRREFGSGIMTDVNAMARLGLLYLRDGVWRDTRILASSFVQQVHTVPSFLADLPITNPTDYPNATHHYGLLWWNNADGRMAGVPKDAYWSWGLGDTLIIVIPSLDIVVSRAGDPIRATPATDPANLEGFVAPIVASVQTTAPATAAVSPVLQANASSSAASDTTVPANAPAAVSVDPDQTVVLPETVASSQLVREGAPPERATWLGFEQSTSSDGAEATLRIRVARVSKPGTIEVHRVLGTWDAQTVASADPPPIDPVPVATYTVETDDSGLALETDVSSAVSSWKNGDAANGFVLIDVTGDAVIAANGPGDAAEIRLER